MQKCRWVIASLAATLVVSGATVGSSFAADLNYPMIDRRDPQVRAGLWQGFYLGANAGYGIGHVKAHSDPLTFHAKGGVGGLHAGYNWQFNRLVLGVEGDYGFASMAHTKHIGEDSMRVHYNSFGSMRGRAGLTFDRMLVYGTLGYGWTNMKISYAGDTLESRRHANSGLVYGGGLEYKLSNNWSLRGEVLRYDASGHWRSDDGSKTKLHSPATEFRAGMSWHFN